MSERRKETDKKSNNDLTTGKVIAIFITAMLLMALGLGAAFLAAYLQDAGVSAKIYTPIGFSLFAFLAAALILLLTNFKKILAYDIHRDLKKLDAQEFLILQGASERKITEACVQHKFVSRDGDYFHKRKYAVFQGLYPGSPLRRTLQLIFKEKYDNLTTKTTRTTTNAFCCFSLWIKSRKMIW